MDELYHWKYIDRYKGKNGKWVYVYPGKTKFSRSAKEFIDTKITGKAYKQDAEFAKNKLNCIENQQLNLKNMRIGTYRQQLETRV